MITKNGVDAVEVERKLVKDAQTATKPAPNNSKNIFISYASEDRNYALRLYNDLRSVGLNPWIDVYDIKWGQRWENVIVKAIESSTFFLPLFSFVSVDKRGTIQKEFKLGIETAEKIPEGQIFIIPIKINECKIPYSKIEKLQYIEMLPDWNSGLNRLLRSLTDS